MIPVVKQAAESAMANANKAKKCSFVCGKKTEEDPAKLKSGTQSDEQVTCKKDAQDKAMQQIQDATGDAAKSKKLFEEDLCSIYQTQLNCFGDDKDACEAAIPDLKKATSRAS